MSFVLLSVGWIKDRAFEANAMHSCLSLLSSISDKDTWYYNNCAIRVIDCFSRVFQSFMWMYVSYVVKLETVRRCPFCIIKPAYREGSLYTVPCV